MAPAEVIKILLDATLKGRGGAGFPAGRKWGFVPTEPDWPRPMFLVCNADEMEPGAFKDRVLIEGSPHQLLEGMAIAAYAVGATVAFAFVRAEYGMPAATCEEPSRRLRPPDILATTSWARVSDLDLRLHVSAGRYICGEASAMLNAIEGRASRPSPQAAASDQVGALEQADRGEQRGDAGLRAGDHFQRGRLVPRPGPGQRGRNEGLHGQR